MFGNALTVKEEELGKKIRYTVSIPKDIRGKEVLQRRYASATSEEEKRRERKRVSGEANGDHGERIRRSIEMKKRFQNNLGDDLIEFVFKNKVLLSVFFVASSAVPS